ncbi:hypothetical protein SAZ_32635 [Streptomyces noursei ZPM]|uniref:Uncharacterized protein n=1 Tax=Streptomyces noursei TaxID=1971 RepID=A0A401R9Z1_STRNR|nr:hypothetical protein [Streptomyces noursei]AKA08986.1 hypothetical protein SAZ_32635 [Streptomyces noursei ZPM]EOT05920.1 hypothetical protein K530_01182 [Streptomyces noursei CCRC 11814]UWS75170.1 hypothetical protein N1H47_30385 [Streptomyces noursei]GCB94434.1 hypothetical protein SALB_07233 [Streptomyces noursei]
MIATAITPSGRGRGVAGVVGGFLGSGTRTDDVAAAMPSADLVAALDRRQARREQAARAEPERLAASVIAPAREGIAAGRPTQEGGA